MYHTMVEPHHTMIEPLSLNLVFTVKLLGVLLFSYLSLVVRKPVFGVSDQVRHKAGCTATEDG